MAMTGKSINSISTDDWDKLRTSYSNSNTTLWDPSSGIYGTTANTMISDSSSVQQYPIKGKMLAVQHTVEPQINFSEKGIKQYLIEKLANGLMDQNVVEFTKMQKPDGSIEYRARIFVTPNDQVQILRTAGIK